MKENDILSCLSRCRCIGFNSLSPVTAAGGAITEMKWSRENEMSDHVKPLPLLGYIRMGMSEKPRVFARPLMGAEREAVNELVYLAHAMLIELGEVRDALPESLKKYVDIGAANVALLDVSAQARSIIGVSNASQARLENLRRTVLVQKL